VLLDDIIKIDSKMNLVAGVLLAILAALAVMVSSRSPHWPVFRSPKRCIAVLARGDPDGNYDLLRSRQMALSKLPWTRTWDHVIFHEGNITEKECGIPARYIDVSRTFLKFQKEVSPSPICATTCLLHFPMGYRSMCLFWFDDFLDYLSEYDEILRIDDDCQLYLGVPEPRLPPDALFAASKTQGCDAPEFTDGMVELFSNIDPTTDFSSCSHPYTNVMWVDVQWAMATRGLKSAMLESNCIQLNRWGDLPLWGYFLKMMGVAICELPISYFHGSHNVVVNR
jgi:hypothetical protein